MQPFEFLSKLIYCAMAGILMLFAVVLVGLSAWGLVASAIILKCQAAPDTVPTPDEGCTLM